MLHNQSVCTELFSFLDELITYLVNICNIYKVKVSKGAKVRNRIQSSTTPDPGHLWESNKLTVDTTNESQEISRFPAGDHKAHINKGIANTSQNKHKRSTKEVPPWNGQ